MRYDQGFRRVRSADRTLDLLELLAERPDGASFGEIAARLALPKSSLSGLLRTLIDRQYVVRTADGRRFRLGMKALALGTSASLSQSDLLAAVAHLGILAQQTELPAFLAIRDGTDVLYIAASAAAAGAERRFAAYATAAGKCLLAHLPPGEELPHALLAALTPATITSPISLRRELATIRRLGYAYESEERAIGQYAIAAPVLDARGQVVAALEVTIPRDQLDRLDLVRLPTAVIVAAGRGADEPASPWLPQRVKVAWSMGTLRNQAYQIVYRTVEQLAESYGADVLWADARDSHHKQIVDVSTLLTFQPDILLIHPADTSRAASLFALAAAAGVTAINFQRPVRNGADLFVGGDTFEQGRMTAAFVARLLSRRSNVAMISGDSHNDNARNLAQGTRSELQRHPHLHIVCERSCAGWSRAAAHEATLALLREHGDALHAIIAANDDMAGGVAEALAAQQRAGKVILVGGDGDLDALQRIKSGVQQGTAFQNWMELGRETLRFAVAAAQGRIDYSQLTQRSTLYDPPNAPVYVNDLPYSFVDRSNIQLLEQFWTEAISMALPEMLPLVAPALRAMDEGR